jgi:hydrogenase expression/formation protein HypC
MKVVALEGDRGIVELNGVQHEAGVVMLEDVAIGDYVIIHAGFAIEKLDEQEALETLDLIQQMYESMDEVMPHAIS